MLASSYTSTDKHILNILPTHILDNFHVIGINFHHSPASIRSLFALDNTQQAILFNSLKSSHVLSAFVISTCGRTELYAFAENVDILIQLFVKKQDQETNEILFQKHGFVYSGMKAVEHLFRLASGLDSPIIGDYEILGQIKKSIVWAQQCQMIGPIMDRIVNFAIQVGKKARTETNISKGTVSVSYATIEWLRDSLPIQDRKKILLIGLGELGNSIAKNICQYLPESELTIANRSIDKSIELANELSVQWQDIKDISQLIDNSQIIIACMQAIEPFILASYFHTTIQKKYILDLSIPSSVEKSLQNIEAVKIINVDEISSLLNNTISKRNKDIPHVKDIIQNMMVELAAWLKMHQHAASLQSLKEKMLSLQAHQMNHTNICEIGKSFIEQNAQKNIDKTIGGLAKNLRQYNNSGCQYIHTFHNFLKEHYQN